MVIDHINGNGLDNRRENLRICFKADNTRNRQLNKNNTSGFKGVSWHKQNKSWVANIKLNYKRIFLGEFKRKVDAAKAYNIKAKELFGSFARLNML